MHQWTEMTKVLQLTVHVFLGLTKEKKIKRLKTKYFSVHSIKKKLSSPHDYYLSFSLLFTSEQEGRSGCSVSA